MPLPVWPVSLPQAPMKEGYGVDQDDPVVRTTMEDGLEVQRRRALTLRSGITAKYMLTKAQATTFKAFLKADLNAGASDFTIPVWSMEASNFVSKTARLAGPVRWEYLGPSHSAVVLSLKIRDF